MPRLTRGEDPKIDLINDLVLQVQLNSGNEENEALSELLEMFKPMILKICVKWRSYFNDINSRIKQWDELVCDAESWFYHYTKNVYTIDGEATYNTFIKQHIDQRIRYIYECELKYYKKHIFPDPDKDGTDDNNDSLERVVYGYKSDHGSTMEDVVISEYDASIRSELAHKILDLLDNDVFSSRDKRIFTEIVYNGKTHDEIARELDVSRTRITQILKKIKSRLYVVMNNDMEIWRLINNSDIDFREK